MLVSRICSSHIINTRIEWSQSHFVTVKSLATTNWFFGIYLVFKKLFRENNLLLYTTFVYNSHPNEKDVTGIWFLRVILPQHFFPGSILPIRKNVCILVLFDFQMAILLFRVGLIALRNPLVIFIVHVVPTHVILQCCHKASREKRPVNY